MKYILSLLFMLSFVFGYTQSEGKLQPQPAGISLPTVMVIPFAKEGTDIREIYEHDLGGPIRAAITLVKEELGQQNIPTTDFRAVLKQLGSLESMTLEQQRSIKQRVIELSAADIYVEVETQIIRTPTGNSATAILTAFDAFTSRSLVNKLGHSPKFYTEQYEKLTEKALDKILEDFSTELKETFINIQNHGRSIALDIGFHADANIDMDSEIGEQGDLLSDIIEQWLEENAFESNFHIQGITATKMIVDEVRIPLRDPKSQKRYRPSRFATQLRKFLVAQGLEVSRDVQGGKIFITISD